MWRIVAPGGKMGMFHSARMGSADRSAAAERSERLSVGSAIIVIVLLSSLSWGVVALVAVGLYAAL
jgi:hypothetical protein